MWTDISDSQNLSVEDIASKELESMGILEQIGFSYQTRLKVLVCMTCHCCCIPKHVVAHAKTHFTGNVFPKSLGKLHSITAQVTDLCRELEISETFPTVEPICMF